MASITSSGGYSNDSTTWPEWIVWPGPKRLDPRLAHADGADTRLPDDGTTRHAHLRRQWVEENLFRRTPIPRDVLAAEWQRRHPGIPYDSDEAAEMRPDDYPA